MTNSYLSSKINYINNRYLNIATKYNNSGYTDDRQNVVNAYKTIINTLKELPEEPTLMIRIAINDLLDTEIEFMDKIIEMISQENRYFKKEGTQQ